MTSYGEVSTTGKSLSMDTGYLMLAGCTKLVLSTLSDVTHTHMPVVRMVFR